MGCGIAAGEGNFLLNVFIIVNPRTGGEVGFSMGTVAHHQLYANSR